ncbi:MAG: fructose PTS transporter subunit IIA [Candidatus Omnitrophota bacterium]
MLVIVMHNNQDYLECLSRLAVKKEIKDFTIIKKKGIGTRLLGGGINFIFSRGSRVEAYEKAFAAIIKGEEKTKLFLDAIEGDDYLERVNIEDKGFVCVLPFSYITNFELEMPSKSKETEIKISSFLKEDRITLNLKASGKEDSIKKMAALLKDAPEISDFDLFLNDVSERESLNTTGIGDGIAIPHARTQAVNEFVISIGRSLDGIDFGALDNKPAKLIFLMGTPKDKGLNSYLRILARLTRLLRKDDFRKSLRGALSPKEIIEQFRKIED